jgi:cytochrome c-type biogenesis protein CcmE
MTPRTRRLIFVGTALVLTIASVTVGLFAFRAGVVFYRAPVEIATGNVPERAFRLGGLVAMGSVRHEGERTEFGVTDNLATVTVLYDGALPDLFSEGEGVVAEGRMDAEDGVFIASRVLARHDETYMPPEVAEALERAERYQQGGGKTDSDGQESGGAAGSR